MPPDASPKRSDFAARVIALMREAGLRGEVTHDEIAEKLVHAERGPFDLEAADRHFTGPGVRPDNDDVLHRVVVIYVRPPAVPRTWDEARTRVLPTILEMARPVLRAFEVDRGTEKQIHRYAAITDHIAVEVGCPMEGGTASASDELLSMWGLDFEGALNQATTNLSRKGTPPWKVSPDDPGVWRSPWSDGFDASRILLPQVLRSLPVRGDPVLILHAPSCVLAAEWEPLSVYPKRLLGRTFPAEWQRGKMALMPWGPRAERVSGGLGPPETERRRFLQRFGAQANRHSPPKVIESSRCGFRRCGSRRCGLRRGRTKPRANAVADTPPTARLKMTAATGGRRGTRTPDLVRVKHAL